MTVLKQGSRGAQVKELQLKLVALGYNINPDGSFGPATHDAVLAYQLSCGLIVDGIVGRATLESMSGKMNRKDMTEEALIAAAKSLKVDICVLRAFIEVEAGGSGFLPSGHPKILYERHYMYRLLTNNEHGLLAKIAHKERPDLVNPKGGGYRGGEHEVMRLSKAKELHVEYALRSCSWGAFQIMGDHAENLGYESVFDFVECMSESEDKQLAAVVRFINKNRTLRTNMRNKTWPEIARLYNGPNYKENNYDVKLEEAYLRHSQNIKK